MALTIITQPKSQIIIKGKSVTFSVVAENTTPPLPVPDFTWLDEYGAMCPQLYVGFDRPITTSNLSTGADSYLWETSWGETSIEENPVLTCPRCPPLPWPGSEFWVRLTVTNGTGSVPKQITIVPIEV